MEFKDYIAVLRRRWLVLVLVGGATFAGALAIAHYRRVPVFEASTKVYLQSQRASDMIAAKLVGELRMPILSPRTRLSMARSEPVLELAARILRGEETEHPDIGNIVFDGLSPSERAARERQYALLSATNLMGRIGFDIDIELHIGRITATAGTAREAVDVVNAVTLALQASLGDLVEQNVIEMRDELESRLRAARADLLEKETALTELRRSLGLPSTVDTLDEEIRLLLSSKESLRNQLDATARELAEFEAKGEQFEQDPEPFRSQAPPSPAMDDIRTRLRGREAEIARLKEQYTDTHPTLAREIRLQQDEQERLERETKENENRWMEDFVHNLNEQLATLQSRSDMLAGQIEEKDRQVQLLSAKIDEYDLARREVLDLEEQTGVIFSLLRGLRIKESFLPEPLPVEKLASRASEKSERVSATVPFFVIIAVLAAFAAVYVSEFLDDRIRTPHAVRRYLNLPILSTIPEIAEKEDLSLMQKAAKDPLSEIYMRLGAVLVSDCQKRAHKVLMITSTIPREGKTTLTANLGIALARNGYRVAVVDADMRQPSLHSFLAMENTQGLAEFLEGKVEARALLEQIRATEEQRRKEEVPPPPEDRPAQPEPSEESEDAVSEEAEGELEPGDLRALQRMKQPLPPPPTPPVPEEDLAAGLEGVLQQTSVRNLFLFSGGRPPANPARSLRSDRMRSLMTHLKTRFDFVLLDTPPLESTVDPLAAAPAVDGALLLISSGLARRHEVIWAKRMLENVDITIHGVVLNRLRVESRGYYYYYEGKKYYESRE